MQLITNRVISSAQGDAIGEGICHTRAARGLLYGRHRFGRSNLKRNIRRRFVHVADESEHIVRLAELLLLPVRSV